MYYVYSDQNKRYTLTSFSNHELAHSVVLQLLDRESMQ